MVIFTVWLNDSQVGDIFESSYATMLYEDVDFNHFLTAIY